MSGAREPLSFFRCALAIVALAGGLIGMTALFFVPIPPGNREPLLLALGLGLGWGSTVIGYEFGSSPAGREAARAGTRGTEGNVPRGTAGRGPGREGRKT